jgi:uncharacterized protein YozE (UPF0346 family)
MKLFKRDGPCLNKTHFCVKTDFKALKQRMRKIRKTGGKIMAKSFYQYLMKFRQEKALDEISQFANDAFKDLGFPKSSCNYEELSSYLELNGHYLKSMATFDKVWEMYQAEE